MASLADSQLEKLKKETAEKLDGLQSQLTAKESDIIQAKSDADHHKTMNEEMRETLKLKCSK